MLKLQKIIFSLFFLLAFTGSTLAQETDFRKTNWGMTVEEVKNAETAKLTHETDTFLSYATRLDVKDFHLGYYFGEDGLYRAIYLFAGKHTNQNLYFNSYDSLKAILENKYGTPVSDDVIWRNRLYADDRSQYGFAVSIGHLAVQAEWKTEKTHIFLILKGDNYDINLFVRYDSIALAEAEEARKQEDLEDVF